MNAVKGQYSIKQAAEITRLTPGLIRKWEERYQLISPERAANGYRLYSDEDLHKLSMIQQWVEQGYSVKNAVSLLKESNHVGGVGYSAESREDTEDHKVSEYVSAMLEAGSICDESTLESMILRISHHHGIPFLINHVFIPFLQEIGRRWETGVWSEYQEHLSSLVIRNFLLNFRKTYTVDEGNPLMLGSCLPGEQHEIPMLIVLVQAMLHGWRTLYLGASPAPGAIESLIDQVGPDFVVLSASTSCPFTEYPKILADLDRFASACPNIRFFVGGEGTRGFLQGQTFEHLTAAYNAEDVITQSKGVVRK